MIKGNLIILRALRSSDLESINTWRNNLQNRILTQGFRGPVTMEIDSAWLQKVIINNELKDIYFGIEEKQSDLLIGIIQLNAIDYISGVATCGILIGENERRGNKLGAEAFRAILFYAFFILNLRKIITYIASNNIPAFKVQEKVGKASEEGCLKSHYNFNGEYVDLHIRSFFREDFKFLKDEYSI
jgi:RimJ/RimL family protein N-acetyltransferase